MNDTVACILAFAMPFAAMIATYVYILGVEWRNKHRHARKKWGR